MSAPTSKDKAVLAVTSEVGAGGNDADDGAAQAYAFKAEETGEGGNVLSRMGNGELAWQVGDEAWNCDSGASTDMTPSAGRMTSYYRKCILKLRIADGSTRLVKDTVT